MKIEDLGLTDGNARTPPAARRISGRPYPERTGVRLPAIPKKHAKRRERMSHSIETELVGIEDVVCNSDPWGVTTKLASTVDGRCQTLNARSVEFIAQPGKIRELRNCIQGSLMDHLKKQRGFSSAIVLVSHKEPRLVLVMSFWKAEKDATGNRWESSATVLKMISPLIDVCSRVHTYEAVLPNGVDGRVASISSPLC